MSPSTFKKALFLKRLNRFLTLVEVDGQLEEAHLPNSGRLWELLIPGTKALVREVRNPTRKTPYNLWGIYTGKIWVCVDALHANNLFLQALHQGLFEELNGFDYVRREIAFDHRRLDFIIGKGREKHLVEVKSVTLVRQGVALFPDAPTKRGKMHLEILTGVAQRKQRGGVVFVVQREDASSFSPNKEMDPPFGKALKDSFSEGVWIVACKFTIREGWADTGQMIPVVL